MFSTPILFLIYKNIPVTVQAFDRICQIKPSNLYIAADGPKCSEEQEECSLLRDTLLDMVDWDCNIHTLFRTSNLGLKLAVSSAIDWFFSNNDRGIILEYDCLPDISFFNFCEKLLTMYENDTRIFSISGNNILVNDISLSASSSYFFSSFTPVWGWATWRRSWNYWKGTLDNYQEFNRLALLNNKLGHSRSAVRFWKKNFDDVYSGISTTTWAFCFNYYQLLNSGLCIVPQLNLVRNIGFGPQAAHATYDTPLSDLPLLSIKELIHPSIVTADQQYDISFSRLAGYIPFSLRIKIFLGKIKSILKSYFY